MALATREELESVWRALSGSGTGDGWSSIAISGLSGNRLLAGRHFPGNDEALLVGFHSATLPPAAQLPEASGFRVERVVLDRPGQWLALVRQPAASADMFSRMAADIVATLDGNAASDDTRLFHLFTGRIRSWQQFMKNGTAGLSPEAELGLVGELHCLATLLEAGISSHAVTKGWKGPLDGLQDFELGHGAIEVKSTMAAAGFTATILSLEQLDDSVRQPLFVCCCRFAAGAGGASLPERIAWVREEVGADASALVLFDNAVLHSGYSDMHADHYTRRFVAAGTFFRRVDETFPKLTAFMVPAGVRRARYEIDLDASSGTEFSIDDVIKMIGIA